MNLVYTKRYADKTFTFITNDDLVGVLSCYGRCVSTDE